MFGTEEGPAEITFNNTGQSLVQKIDEMLGAPPVEVKLDLAPKAEDSMPGAPERDEQTPRSHHQERDTIKHPTLRSLGDLLVGHLPGRILLVRLAPQLPGMNAVSSTTSKQVLVVVDQNPGELRPKIDQLLTDHFSSSSDSAAQNGSASEQTPELHLMEQESYQTLLTLTGGDLERSGSDDASSNEFYRVPSMPAPSSERSDKQQEEKLQKARDGFDTAGKRLKFAQVVLQGGFPEEVLRPINQALSWAVTSYLSLVNGCLPSDELSSPRLIHAKLVESKRIEVSLAAELANVRELTAPPADDEDDAPPPSVETAESLIETVQNLVDRGNELVAEAGM